MIDVLSDWIPSLMLLAVILLFLKFGVFGLLFAAFAGSVIQLLIWFMRWHG